MEYTLSDKRPQSGKMADRKKEEKTVDDKKKERAV